MTFFLSCNKIVENKTPKEIFTIPNNLDNFLVIYRDKKNIDYKKNIEYLIPKNGILYVDFQRKNGKLNQIFRSENGIEISNFAYENFKNNAKTDEIYVLDIVDGKIAKPNEIKNNTDSINLSTENLNSIKWIGVILGKPNSNQNQLRGKLFKKIDSISKEK